MYCMGCSVFFGENMKKNITIVLGAFVSMAFIASYVAYFKIDRQRALAAHEEFAAIRSASPDVADAALPRSGALKNQGARVSGEVGASRPSSGASLAFERNLLSGNALDSVKIKSLLLSEKFDILLDQFARETAMDADASELSEVYGKLLRGQVGENNLSVHIDRFVCGTQICIGSLQNGDDAQYARWSTVFFGDPKTPSYGFVDATVARKQGGADHRFIFSIDPAANGVVIPTPRP